MTNPFRKYRMELRAARRPPASVVRLKEFSPLAWLVERMFFWLELLSPSIFFIETRSLQHARLHDIEDVELRESYVVERTKHHSVHVDTYILACILIQVALVPILWGFYVSSVRWFVLIVVGVRILDIIQANANINVFDHLRYGESSHVTASLTRNLILSAITFVELLLSFGLLYTALQQDLVHGTRLLDPFYFSVVTQLTIGYGDIQPIGAARVIAISQGIVGLFFSLLIMGRLVSFLPSARTVMGDMARTGEKEQNGHRS